MRSGYDNSVTKFYIKQYMPTGNRIPFEPDRDYEMFRPVEDAPFSDVEIARFPEDTQRLIREGVVQTESDLLALRGIAGQAVANIVAIESDK